MQNLVQVVVKVNDEMYEVGMLESYGKQESQKGRITRDHTPPPPIVLFDFDKEFCAWE